MLQERLFSHGIKVGRDYLYDLLAAHRLLIRKRKRRIVTTNSRHWMKKYSNLIKNLPLERPEQVWVSDITYIRVGSKWGYLSLITDAYSKKIMGYGFRMDLSTQGCLDALKMALRNRKYNQSLIHHSDRGSQYCSQLYTDMLVTNKIAISMTENGDPYENAIAERVNGIIKDEFGLNSTNSSFEKINQVLSSSIQSYNHLRPHASCNYLTPDQAHLTKEKMKKRWKNYRSKNYLNQQCIVDPGLTNSTV